MKDKAFIHKICACGTNLRCAKRCTGMEKNMKDQFVEKEEFADPILELLYQTLFSARMFSGSRFVYKKLKTQVKREKITVKIPIAEVLKRSEVGLQSLGDLIKIPIEEKPVLAATYGSGFGNMNPAVICIEFTDNGNYETTLEIAAYGKEGLINQKTASKAIAMFTHVVGLN